jgi:hypothetical protein
VTLIVVVCVRGPGESCALAGPLRARNVRPLAVAAGTRIASLGRD